MSTKTTAGQQPMATPADLATFLGGDFPEKTLANWRSQGKGPKFVKVGRHVRYRWADVNAWLDEQAAEVA